MQLSDDQQKATDAFLDFLQDDSGEQVMLIEGYPGCGKSFLTKHLIAVARSRASLLKLLLDENKELRICCTATTNKAARILSEFIEEPTTTIHKLLGLKVSFNATTGEQGLKQTWRKGNSAPIQLSNTLIFIDEASYIDTKLLEIIRSQTSQCKIVYIGDSYQLASFRESSCPVFTSTKRRVALQASKRFSNTSPISTLGAQFRDTIDTGVFKDINYDGKVIRHVSGTEFKREVEKEFTSHTHQDEIAKLIAWSNKRVQAYNKHLRALHTNTPHYEVGEQLITNQPIIATDSDLGFNTEDKVLITGVDIAQERGVNGRWLTLNRKLGVFQADNATDVAELLEEYKKQNEWASFYEAKDFFADLRPVYASTVYKAQGSTYERSYIDLNDIGNCHQPQTLARMLHVAITRASQEVIMYGNLPAKYRG